MHGYELTHGAFNKARLLRLHCVNCTPVINVRVEKGRRRPKNSEAKKDPWKPFLHQRRWLSENAAPDKRRQRQANRHEDETGRGEGPLSVTTLRNIENSDVARGIGS